MAEPSPRANSRRVRTFLAACASILAVACEGGGGGNGTEDTGVSGSVIKGPHSGGEVRIHVILADGDRGGAIAGPFSTSKGEWAGLVPRTAGRFIATARRGSYVDEDTGEKVELGFGQELTGLVDLSLGAVATVTPFTHAILVNVRHRVSQDEDLETAITDAVADFETAFGFDLTTTTPRFKASGTMEEKQYAALVGGLSRLIERDAAYDAVEDAHRFDVVEAVATDFADGMLDGLDANGDPIEVDVDGSPVAIGASDPGGWDALITAANEYAGETPGLEGVMLPGGIGLP